MSNSTDTTVNSTTERKVKLTVEAPAVKNLPGLDSAINRLREVQRMIGATHAAYTAMSRAFSSPVKVAISPPGNAWSGLRGRAAGLLPSTPAPAVGRQAIPVTGGSRHAGRDLVENIRHVGTWTTAVGVFYGALRLARSGLESLVQTQWQEARLFQVLRGGADGHAAAVRRLTDDVMRLAAANGRSADEAMESAIQWSRLGLSRVQVTQAVRTSLMAANVAEMTAAESTEHLSAVMVAYRLNASQLNGVLGMLNQTSNTFNVSNKDLLQGLSRVGAIARQAGLDLSETIGLIGAARGTSGQSGANIANALKTVISRFSRPDLQKKLREQFKIEVTAEGGDDVKSMSEMLGELFIAYQKMNEAERRSMLYSVGGAHQISRLAAMLDSYVRAQVLAINAQLNLNSAEKENELITATLKSQITGLVTEWQRFLNLQGNRGAVQGLTEVTRTLHTLLALLNTQAGSWISTAFLALVTALGAKMLLTSVAMARAAQAGGTLAGTFGGVARAMAGLQTLLVSSISQSAPWIQRMAGMGQSAQVAAARIPAVGAAVQKVGAASTAAAAGVGVLRGSVALAAGALVEMLPIVVAVYAAMKLLNAAAEGLGVTSNAADETVGKFEGRAQKSEAAAEAAARASKLYATTRKALENSKTETGRLAIVSQVAEATNLPEPGDTKEQLAAKEKLRASTRTELEAIEKVGNTQERNARRGAKFAVLEAAAIAMRARQRQQEFELMRSQDKADRRELARLEKAPFASEDRKLVITDRMAARRDRRTGLLLQDTNENADALAEFERSSTAVKAFQKRQQVVGEALRDIFEQLPGGTAMDRLNRELLFHITLRERLNQQLEANAKAREKADMPDESLTEMNARISGLREQLATRRDDILRQFSEQSGVVWTDEGSFRRPEFASTLAASRWAQYEPPTEPELRGMRLDPRFRGGAVTAAREKALAALDAAGKDAQELDALTGKKASVETSGSRMLLESQRQQLSDDVQTETATIAGLDNPANRSLLETADQRSVAIRIGEARIGALGVGETEGERMASQVKALETSTKRGGWGENEELLAMQERVSLSELRIKAEERLIDLRREGINLAKEETREYQRGLLSAGPGELLRKLAVGRMSQAGMTAGQFMSLDQGARQDVMNLPGNSNAARANARGIKALEGIGAGGAIEDISSTYLKGSQARASLYAGLSQGTLAGIAPDVLDKVNSAANRVSGSFEVLAGKVSDLGRRLDAVAPQSGVPGGPPANPQATTGRSGW